MSRLAPALVVTLAVLVAPVGVASTPVSGQITGDQIWTAEGSPYLPTGPVTVNAGVTLTLEPGTVVEFAATSFLLIHGTLLAQGTAGDPVQLLPAGGGTGWYGILYYADAGSPLVDVDGNYLSGPILEHVQMTGGGDDAIATAGLTLLGAAPYVRNVSFADGGGEGISGSLDPGRTLHVVSCSFSGHDTDALTVTGGTVRVVDSDFTDNNGRSIHIDGGAGHRLLATRIEQPDGDLSTQGAIVVENAADVVVEDCEIDPLGIPTSDRRGILLDAVAGATVENNRLRHTGPAIEVRGSDAVIRGNRVQEGNTSSGSALVRAESVPDDQPGLIVEDNVIEGEWTGLSVSGFRDPEIRGNFLRTSQGGIDIDAPAPWGAIVEDNLILDGTTSGLRMTAHGAGVVIRNNTIQGFDGPGFFAAGVGTQATPALVEGNVISHNGGRGVRIAGGVLEFRGNDLSHNVTTGDTQTGTGPGEGNLVYLNSGATADFAGDAVEGVYNRMVDDAPGAAAEYAVYNESPDPVDLSLVCWGTQGPTVLDEPGSSSTTAPTADCSLLDVPDGPAIPKPPLAVRPNPGRASSVISFSLAGPGPVDLRVYDVRGREVVRLAEGLRPAGLQEIPWDGRDAAGRSVAAGVYLIQIRTLGGVATRRLVRLTP